MLFRTFSDEWSDVFECEISHEQPVHFHTSDLAIYSPKGALSHAMKLDKDLPDLTCIQRENELLLQLTNVHTSRSYKHVQKEKNIHDVYKVLCRTLTLFIIT